MAAVQSPPREGPVVLPSAITVKELGEALDVSPIEVIKRLMTHGVMAAMNQTVSYDTAALVAVDLGREPSEQKAAAPAVQASDIEHDDQAETLVSRPPVVTILGHVDHGKTSLLDAIRKSRVAAGEHGGITQHIGAYQVERNGGLITFIDTPGHAAFTAMRARGAQVTDIAVLVVAADDGVMPQTIEAIGHAQAAGVPLIVAVNKMDLPGANPDRVKQQLTEHNVIVEDFGGEVIAVPVSATKGTGLEDLLDTITLVAEVQELKANPNREADGVVIEAELDTARGPIATVLVQGGTLRVGDALVAGEISGKVKAMFDDTGARLREAGPSTPAVVLGLEEVPPAGERFRVVEDERTARQLVDDRQRKRVQDEAAGIRVSLETLFNEVSTGKLKELVIVLRADVKGSVEAIRASLDKLSSGEVKVKVIFSGTGPITDSDINLAQASNGVVLGFNTRIEPTARRLADSESIDVRQYTIIYQLLEDVEKAVKGLYEPVYHTVVDGQAEVRQIFRSSRVGQIAGCFVIDGTIRRGLVVRIKRGKDEIGKGRCDGLKRFKDDVREVNSGYECGVVIDGFTGLDIGDIVEFVHEERVN